MSPAEATSQTKAARTRVDTRKVDGRRVLRFERVSDILADAESLAQTGYRSLGNWSLGQCATHLSGSVLMGLDGAPFRVSFLLRLILRPFRRRFLTRPLPPGYKAPRNNTFNPSPTREDQAGLAALRTAVERWQREPQRQTHPVFGEISAEEWEQFECRHAELHMSFLVPK